MRGAIVLLLSFLALPLRATGATVLLADASGATFHFALQATDGTATTVLVTGSVPFTASGSLAITPGLIGADVSWSVQSTDGPFVFSGEAGGVVPWQLTLSQVGFEAPTAAGTAVTLPYGTIDWTYLNPGGPGLLQFDLAGSLTFNGETVPVFFGPSTGGPACGGYVECYGLGAHITTTGDSLVIDTVNALDQTYAPGGFVSGPIGTIQGVTFNFTQLGFAADRFAFVPEPSGLSVLGLVALAAMMGGARRTDPRASL